MTPSPSLTAFCCALADGAGLAGPADKADRQLACVKWAALEGFVSLNEDDDDAMQGCQF